MMGGSRVLTCVARTWRVVKERAAAGSLCKACELAEAEAQRLPPTPWPSIQQGCSTANTMSLQPGCLQAGDPPSLKSHFLFFLVRDEWGTAATARSNLPPSNEMKRLLRSLVEHAQILAPQETTTSQEPGSWPMMWDWLELSKVTEKKKRDQP